MNESTEDKLDSAISNMWSESHLASPQILHHYTTSESATLIIKGNTFRASAFECMNDTKEFRHGLQIALSEIQKQVDSLNTSHNTEVKNRWRKFIESEISNPLLRPYIISLCEDGSNEHLWGLYSKNHTGIKLKIINDTKNSDLRNGFFIKCFYDESEAKKKLNVDLNNFTNIYNQSPNVPNLTVLFRGYLQAAFKFSISIKDHMWSAEKEWRFVILINRNEQEEKKLPYGKIQFKYVNTNIFDYLNVDLTKAHLKIVETNMGKNFLETSRNSLLIFMKDFPDILIDGSESTGLPKEKSKRKLIFFVMINIFLSMIPIILFYLDLRHDLRAGVFPSDGDNILIPAISFALFWLLIILVLNVGIYIFKRRQR